MPKNNRPDWRFHDCYNPGVSSNRAVITRSQTCFKRLKNTKSDLELFADKTRYEPPDKPHLMLALKGTYGAIPRTIITRSVGKYLTVDKNLVEKVNAYKNPSAAKDEEKVPDKKGSVEDKAKKDSTAVAEPEAGTEEEGGLLGGWFG